MSSDAPLPHVAAVSLDGREAALVRWRATRSRSIFLRSRPIVARMRESFFGVAGEAGGTLTGDVALTRRAGAAGRERAGRGAGVARVHAVRGTRRDLGRGLRALRRPGSRRVAAARSTWSCPPECATGCGCRSKWRRSTRRRRWCTCASPSDERRRGRRPPADRAACHGACTSTCSALLLVAASALTGVVVVISVLLGLGAVSIAWRAPTSQHASRAP